MGTDKTAAAPDPRLGHDERQHAASLFLPGSARRQWDNYLTDVLASVQERFAHASVTPTVDLAVFRSQLSDFDFATPRDAEPLLSWTIEQMEQGIVHLTSPRYFGLFNPGPTTPAQWADRIVATFNPQLATWTTSPVAVELEAHVIRAVIARAGLPPEASGHFTTGGAEANYTALICALTHANSAFAVDGARAFPGPPVFYISKDSHLAWLKIAHQAGIGRSAVRLVATDGTGRLDASALAQVMTADRASGCIPIMIVATAGTTNAGMLDPLLECARLAREADAWFHVDAAWGGAVIASETHRHLLSGIENADSVTIDAHKWFATTMGCGMFLTRHEAVCQLAFTVFADYMPSNDHGRDPYTLSLQWSRRFLGLRLFLSLALVGWNGYGQHIDRAIDLAGELEHQLAKRGWQTVNRSPLAVLCIEPPAEQGDVRSIVRSVLASGRAWVSVATFEGRAVIRACIANGETTSQDIATLVNELMSASQMLSDTNPVK